jgi:MoxR-like ATPase
MSSIAPATTEADLDRLLGSLEVLRQEIAKVIVGQDQAIEELLVTFLAGGHALLEGVPGLAKTLMIRTLADAVDLTFRRIQFTPDLMPSDVIGTEVLEEDHATGRRFFKFVHGPLFANIVLADEINRTPPKTQAALLEAMQEYEVTYGGTTYPLDRPFFVLATQNPIEQTGTYPLPEAQLDRFLMYIRVAYPDEAEEVAILRRTTGDQEQKAVPVMTGEEVIQLQSVTRQIHIGEDALTYAAHLVRASRPATSQIAYVREWVHWGAGPRAGQALVLAAKATAFIRGRLAVTLDDLRAVAAPVLRHRLIVHFRAEAEGIHPDDITTRILEEVRPPQSPLG